MPDQVTDARLSSQDADVMMMTLQALYLSSQDVLYLAGYYYIMENQPRMWVN